jgi:3-oxoadipate enol-lactonase
MISTAIVDADEEFVKAALSCYHRGTEDGLCPMATISINGIELYYQESGSGYPLVLLHGLGSCGDDWWFQTPVFAQRFRVILPNLRGHQLSSPLRGPVAMQTLADDVAQLMEALNIRRAHVLGLSLGGAVAQVLALAFPEKVDRLILVNTFAHLRPTSLRAAYTLARRVVVSKFLPPALTAQVVARDLFPKPEQAQLRAEVISRSGANDVRSYRYLVDTIRRFDSRRELDRITAPTLLITGDRDAVVPRGCQQQLVRGLPTAQWRVVNDSGHATPVDRPEEFNQIVLDFLTL